MGSLAMVLLFVTSYVIRNNREQLGAHFVFRKISNLYQDIHIYRDSVNVWYYPVFMARRIIFVVIPTFLFALPSLEIQILLLGSSLYVIFYAGIKPHNTMNRVKLEIFNESMIMVIQYHMVMEAFEQGSEIMAAEDPVKSIYFILQGICQLEIFCSGKSHKIEVLKSSDTFG